MGVILYIYIYNIYILQLQCNIGIHKEKTQINSDFEKKCFKLMNSSILKTIDNSRPLEGLRLWSGKVHKGLL